jgi:hypothetical protein
VSDQGRFSEFLEEKRLGKNLEADTIYDSLVALLSGKLQLEIDTAFDVSQFSYRALAKQLISNIQENQSRNEQ